MYTFSIVCACAVKTSNYIYMYMFLESGHETTCRVHGHVFATVGRERAR